MLADDGDDAAGGFGDVRLVEDAIGGGDGFTIVEGDDGARVDFVFDAAGDEVRRFFPGGGEEDVASGKDGHLDEAESGVLSGLDFAGAGEAVGRTDEGRGEAACFEDGVAVGFPGGVEVAEAEGGEGGVVVAMEGDGVAGAVDAGDECGVAAAAVAEDEERGADLFGFQEVEEWGGEAAGPVIEGECGGVGFRELPEHGGVAAATQAEEPGDEVGGD